MNYPVHPVLLKRLWGRDWRRLIIFSVCLALYLLMIVSLFPSFADMQMAEMMEQLPSIMQSMFGGADLDFNSLVGWILIGVNHPVMIVIFAAMGITIGARAVAGEISTRTSDVLFATPMKRYQVIWTNLLFIVIGSLLLAFGCFAGIFGGSFFIDLEFSVIDIVYVCLNAAFLYLALGAITILISVFVRKASTTVAYSSGLVAILFFISFLGDFWSAIEFLVPFSLFTNFNVEAILTGQAGLGTDLITLVLVTFAAGIISQIKIAKIDL